MSVGAFLGVLSRFFVIKRSVSNGCTSCGACANVYQGNASPNLQPTFLEAGLEGIWSPIIIPKIGYCEYRCTLCGQVCPTGAIKRLTLQEKQRLR